MRLIKLAIISFVAIFLVVFLLSLLIPSHVREPRHQYRCAGRFRMAQLADIRNWKSWNAMLDNPEYKDVKYTEKQFLRRPGADCADSCENRQRAHHLASAKRLP